MNPINILQKDDDKYLKGRRNFMIRGYFYFQSGMQLLDNFHNIFLGIIALVLALKITSAWVMAAIVFPLMIAMVFIGYYNVHNFSKVSEWLGLRFGSHYGIKSFNFTKGSYELLVEIRDLLKKMEQPKT